MKIRKGVIRKPPPDAKQPADEAHGRTHRDHEEKIDRDFGNWQKNLHGRAAFRTS